MAAKPLDTKCLSDEQTTVFIFVFLMFLESMTSHV